MLWVWVGEKAKKEDLHQSRKLKLKLCKLWKDFHLIILPLSLPPTLSILSGWDELIFHRNLESCTNIQFMLYISRFFFVKRINPIMTSEYGSSSNENFSLARYFYTLNRASVRAKEATFPCFNNRVSFFRQRIHFTFPSFARSDDLQHRLGEIDFFLHIAIMFTFTHSTLAASPWAFKVHVRHKNMAHYTNSVVGELNAT